MNKKFNLIFNNGLKKEATIIVCFSYKDDKYLIYSLEENDNNCQIFVSKIQNNSENKCFIIDILPNEKESLSKIVYNIVILLPTNVKKGLNFREVSNNLFENLNLKLNIFNGSIFDQNYCSNSAVAITKKDFVNNAIEIYNIYLAESNSSLPIWSLPNDNSISFNANNSNMEDRTFNSSTSIFKKDNSEYLNSVNLTNNDSTNNNVDNNLNNINLNSDNSVSGNTEYDSATNLNKFNNSDAIFANVADPSLQKFGINQTSLSTTPPLTFNNDNSNNQNNNSGFANSKYIIIGTVCLLLSVVIVVGAYFLINNMK